MKKILTIVFIGLAMMAFLAGCESSDTSVYKASDTFVLNKNHYKLDSINYSEETGSITFRILQREGVAPVQFTMGSGGNSSPVSILEISFSIDEKKYTQRGFSVVDADSEIWKACFEFSLSIPAGSSLPEKITMSYLGSPEETATIKLNDAVIN